jgi:hypothetical protein
VQIPFLEFIYQRKLIYKKYQLTQGPVWKTTEKRINLWIIFLMKNPWTESTTRWTRSTSVFHGDEVRQGTPAVGLRISGRDWMKQKGTWWSNPYRPSMIGQRRSGGDTWCVIPRSEKEGTKPPYVCPGCSNHTHDNNMINRCNVINKQVICLT